MNLRYVSAIAASVLLLAVAALRAPAEPSASAIASSLSAAAAPAASPAAVVPAGMDFMLQVNIRTLLDAPGLQPVRNQILPPGYKQFVDQVYIATGVDLLRDIDRVAIAGKFGAENKGDVAIVFEGRWKRKDVLDVLMNNPQYDSFAEGSQTIHQFWSDKDGDLRCVSFLGPDLAVMGKLKTVQAAIAVFEKRGPAMLDDPALATLAANSQSGSSSDFVQILTRGNAAAGKKLLPGLRGATLQIGAGSDLQFQLAATMADDHAAKLALQTVQGLQALVQLQGRQPELAEAASRIQSSLAGDQGIQAGARLSVEDALRLFNAVRHNNEVSSL